jgi:hypothetical protein
MDKPKPKVGQILYSIDIGNAARRSEEYLDESEASRIHGELRNEFSRYGKTRLNLDQLRRIEQIMREAANG